MRFPEFVISLRAPRLPACVLRGPSSEDASQTSAAMPVPVQEDMRDDLAWPVLQGAPPRQQFNDGGFGGGGGGGGRRGGGGGGARRGGGGGREDDGYGSYRY